jgi:soluble cytochrome b562
LFLTNFKIENISNQIINSGTTTSTSLNKSSTVIISTSHNVVTEERTNYKKKNKVPKIPALRTQIKDQIKSIQNEETLEAVNAMLKALSTKQLIHQITKPKRENLTVEDLIKEQNYKGFDRKGFDKLVAELAVQEPIEALLAFGKTTPFTSPKPTRMPSRSQKPRIVTVSKSFKKVCISPPRSINGFLPPSVLSKSEP